MMELSVAEQRYQAVLAVISDGLSISQVAQKVGVSRQTLHTCWPLSTCGIRRAEGSVESAGELSASDDSGGGSDGAGVAPVAPVSRSLGGWRLSWPNGTSSRCPPSRL